MMSKSMEENMKKSKKSEKKRTSTEKKTRTGMFTYNEAMYLDFEDYKIPVPDGFKYQLGDASKQNTLDLSDDSKRAFTIWKPEKETSETYENSPFVIFFTMLKEVASAADDPETAHINTQKYKQTLDAAVEENLYRQAVNKIGGAVGELAGENSEFSRIRGKVIDGYYFYRKGNYHLILFLKKKKLQCRIMTQFARSSQKYQEEINEWVDRIVLKVPFENRKRLDDITFFFQRFTEAEVDKWREYTGEWVNAYQLIARQEVGIAQLDYQSISEKKGVVEIRAAIQRYVNNLQQMMDEAVQMMQIISAKCKTEKISRDFYTAANEILFSYNDDFNIDVGDGNPIIEPFRVSYYRKQFNDAYKCADKQTIDRKEAEEKVKTKAESFTMLEERKLDDNVLNALKEEAKEAKTLLFKIASAIKKKQYGKLKDIDSVIEKMNEAIDDNIDVMSLSVSHAYFPLANSYEIVYHAHSVQADKFIQGRVKFSITEKVAADGTFNPKDLPKGIVEQLDKLTAESIYKKLLECALGLTEEGNHVFATMPVKTVQAPEPLEISDDLNSVRAFVKTFKQSWLRALDDSNRAIMNEKSTPICRSNDSRIKKILINTEAIIEKYASELQEIILKLDQRGEAMRSEEAAEEDIKDICELISESFEVLHMEVNLKIYKESKKFKHTIDSKYRSISAKWKKRYKTLASVRVQTLQQEIMEKEPQLIQIKKQISSYKRKKTNLGKRIEEETEAIKKAKILYSEETDAFTQKNMQLQGKISAIDSEITSLNRLLKDAERNITALEKEIREKEQNYRAKKKSKEEQSKQLQEKLQMLTDNRQKIALEEAKKKSKAEKAFFFKQKKQLEHDEALKKLSEKDEEISSCNDKIAQISDLLIQLKKSVGEKMESLKVSLNSWNDKEEKLKKMKSSKERTKKSLNKDFQACEVRQKELVQEVTEAENNLNSLKKDFEELDKNIREAEAKRDSMQEEITELEKQQDEIKNMAADKEKEIKGEQV